jgi:hypothetical protein
VNAKQSNAKRMKMAERARQQKDLHFPEVHEDWLWHRSRNDGYTTLPRTMPIVMEIIDALSKGQPAGHVLLTLWCRSPDHALVTIENPAIMASEAGFSGERAVDSWRRRMRKLVELGFINAKSGPAGDFHYVLLKNPNWVVEARRNLYGDVPGACYAKFLDRAMEVGAFGEIEVVRGYAEAWKQQLAAQQAATEIPAELPPQAEAPTPGDPSAIVPTPATSANNEA